MAQLRDIINEALMFLPGADADGAGQMLLNVAQEFFTDSQSWRELLGPYTVKAGRDTIELDPVTSGVNVVVVHHIRHDGNVLPPAILKPLDASSSAVPSWYYQTEPGVVSIVPAASADITGIEVYASLMPTTLDAIIPSMFWTHFRQPLLDGLVGTMQSMSSRPFTDSAGAVLRLRKFRRGIQRAHDFAARGYGVSDRAWAFPRWSGYRGGA